MLLDMPPFSMNPPLLVASPRMNDAEQGGCLEEEEEEEEEVTT